MVAEESASNASRHGVVAVVYFYHMRARHDMAGYFTEVRKLLLLK